MRTAVDSAAELFSESCDPEMTALSIQVEMKAAKTGLSRDQKDLSLSCCLGLR